jgi:hypothetical protein
VGVDRPFRKRIVTLMADAPAVTMERQISMDDELMQ